MKAITIHNPWAWAIIHGAPHKNIENRSWKTDYRGDLLIHAGNSRKSLKYINSVNRLSNCQCNETDFYYGYIIGKVTLVDITRQARSRWAEKGSYHWKLSNPMVISEPIKTKGKLQIWQLEDELAIEKLTKSQFYRPDDRGSATSRLGHELAHSKSVFGIQQSLFHL